MTLRACRIRSLVEFLADASIGIVRHAYLSIMKHQYSVKKLSKENEGHIVCQCNDNQQTLLTFNWGDIKFRSHKPPMFVRNCFACGEEHIITLIDLE